MKIIVAASFLMALAGATALAQAPAAAIARQNQTEVAAEYTYAHANAPPAQCGCFSANGGSVSFAQPFVSGRYAFVFDATIVHGSNISPGNVGVTLDAFTAGGRYRPLPLARWNPFGEALVGVAHAGGGLVSGDTPAARDPGLLFAANIGGGLDRRLDRHWSLRLFEADYLVTTFRNGVNDHQNNLRVSAGLVYRFSK